MKAFFDQDDQTELPQEFEWENMEAGIREKMQQMQETERKSGFYLRFKKYYLLPFLLLILVSGGLAVWYRPELLTGPSAPHITPENLEEKPLNERRPRSTPEAKVLGDSRAKSQPEARVSTAKEQLKKSSPSADPSRPAPFTPIAASAKATASVGVRWPKAKLAIEALDFGPQPIEALASDDLRLAARPGSSSADAPFADSASRRAAQAPSDTAKPPRISAASEAEEDSLLPVLPPKAELWKKGKAGFPQQLLLEGGLSIWDAGSGASLPERDRYESNLLSFQLQGHYRWNIRPKLFLMTGFQYQQLESKLDYRSPISDYQILLRDTVIRVIRNRATGREDKVYGDAEQRVDAERMVIHYNRSRLLKLSFGAGRSWQWERFQADLYAGLAVNTISHNRGRALQNQDLVDYSGSANAVMDNRFLLETFVGARLHYFLDPRLALSAGFQGQKSLMNWSSVEQAQLYPLSLGFNLGLSYRMGE